MEMQSWAYIAGIIFGSGAILAVTIVYIKSQKLGVTGLGFALVGMILVGMSIWSSIKITVDEKGFRTELEDLQGQVETIAQASATVSDTVTSIAEENMRNRGYVSELAAAIETQPEQHPEQIGKIQAELSSAKSIDLENLHVARMMLNDVNAGGIN